MATKKAVHFGAGNIGRGFVGLILHNAGYEVVFVDVSDELISALAAKSDYTVHEVGEGARSWTVDDYRAMNSASDPEGVVHEIATADVVTTAVGPNILGFVAPLIARGIAARDDSAEALVVMACENMIGASSALEEHVMSAMDDSESAKRAIFANTAVDRIVPGQPAGGGIDVTVEAFFEWVIDGSAFDGNAPVIPEATFVPELAPFIERKLFTVNTGHATSAYFGFLAGAETIAEAMADADVAGKVRAVLNETKNLLVARHGLDEEEQEHYLEKNLARFANDGLDDTVARVGRQPLRKLSRHERFVGPASGLIESGGAAPALVAAMVAATRFDVPDDPQSEELLELRATLSTEDFVTHVTELDHTHPLHGLLVTALDSGAKKR